MKVNHKEIRLTTSCPFCGKTASVWVNEIDYLDWQDGELVQNAFPYLSADEREMLISGICPTCWDGMFGIPEDDGEVLDEDWEVPEDDEDYEDDPDWGYNEDMGFDAYLGCYTDDC